MIKLNRLLVLTLVISMLLSLAIPVYAENIGNVSISSPQSTGNSESVYYPTIPGTLYAKPVEVVANEQGLYRYPIARSGMQIIGRNGAKSTVVDNTNNTVNSTNVNTNQTSGLRTNATINQKTIVGTGANTSPALQNSAVNNPVTSNNTINGMTTNGLTSNSAVTNNNLLNPTGKRATNNNTLQNSAATNQNTGINNTNPTANNTTTNGTLRTSNNTSLKNTTQSNTGIANNNLQTSQTGTDYTLQNGTTYTDRITPDMARNTSNQIQNIRYDITPGSEPTLQHLQNGQGVNNTTNSQTSTGVMNGTATSVTVSPGTNPVQNSLRSNITANNLPSMNNTSINNASNTTTNNTTDVANASIQNTAAPLRSALGSTNTNNTTDGVTSTTIQNAATPFQNNLSSNNPTNTTTNNTTTNASSANTALQNTTAPLQNNLRSSNPNNTTTNVGNTTSSNITNNDTSNNMSKNSAAEMNALTSRITNVRQGNLIAANDTATDGTNNATLTTSPVPTGTNGTNGTNGTGETTDETTSPTANPAPSPTPGPVNINKGYVVPADVAETRFAEAAQLLGVTGIMIGDEQGHFRPDDLIKRSEYAKIAVTALGLAQAAETARSTTKFGDVPLSHWANGYINVASGQGIIVGDGDGNFRPDDNMSYAEGMAILVRMIGFEPAIKDRGGWPTGYISIGVENGISKNAIMGSSDKVNRGIVSQMTFNTLTVKMMEQVGFGRDAYYEVGNKTLLGDRLKVVKHNGQVVGNQNTKLDVSGSVKSGELQVTSNVYGTSNIYKLRDSSAQNLLGYNVIYYTEEVDDDNEIILMRKDTNKNDEKVVSSGDIDTIKDTTGGVKQLKYWTNKSNNQSETLDIQSGARFILNGKRATLTNEDINISSGRLVLLDTDQNGSYDVILATSYVDYVVDDVYLSSYTVYDKYDQGSLVLDPGDKDITFTLREADGTSVNLADLKEWDVLSVAKSQDGALIDATLVRKPITGRVTEKNSDGAVLINDVWYDIAPTYKTEVKLNDEGTFYLDASDNIAGVNTSSNLNTNYAYLNNAKKTTGIDERLQFELYTRAGETKVLNGAKKYRINGDSGKTQDELLSRITTTSGNIMRQLITYATNTDNEITEINLATVDHNKVGLDNFAQNFAANNVEYKATSRKLSKVGVDSNTIVFEIPAGKTDTDSYAIRNISMFKNNSTYDILAYDIQENLTARAIVVTSTYGSSFTSSPIVIVDKIATALNADNQTIQKLYGLENGVSVQLTTDAADVLKSGSRNLKQGDIIVYESNSKNEITKVHVLKDIDKMTDEFSSLINGDEDNKIIYGKVSSKFSDSINVTVNDGTAENYITTNAKVYVYDSTKASNNLSVGATGDISRYDPKKPSWVFVRTTEDEVQEIVVVK